MNSTSTSTPWLDLPAGGGPGDGKRIVLISGDEEYRSEESLPMLAGILAQHHGFSCRVLFAIDAASGCVDPGCQTNIPGLEALADADLLVIATRFRELPDAQMAHIDAYVRSGRPLIGLRTATHAFHYQRNPDSIFAHYGFASNAPGWEGGFGRRVLGETWVNHHGEHGVEGTRGVVEPASGGHPILRGVSDVVGPTDVYSVRDLPPDAVVLMRGLVTRDLSPDSSPVQDARNTSPMPLVWLRRVRNEQGVETRVLCSTIGASVDFACADLRRLLVNACYWLTGLGERIKPDGLVEPLAPYRPSWFGEGRYRPGQKPADVDPRG